MDGATGRGVVSEQIRNPSLLTQSIWIVGGGLAERVNVVSKRLRNFHADGIPLRQNRPPPHFANTCALERALKMAREWLFEDCASPGPALVREFLSSISPLPVDVLSSRACDPT